MGEKTMDEIVERAKLPIFFIPPDENYDNDDLDTMIDYFITTEEYEKCAILQRIIDGLENNQQTDRRSGIEPN